MSTSRKIALSLWSLHPRMMVNLVKRCSETATVQKAEDLTEAERADQARWPVYRIIGYVYMFLVSCRFLNLAYIELTGAGPWRTFVLQYEVLIRITIQTGLLNAMTGLFCFPITVFPLYFDYLVNVKRYNYIPRLAHSLLVLNGQDFVRLNPQFKVATSVTSPLASLKTNWTLAWYFVKPPSNIVWAYPRLPYFENVSSRTRLRVYYFSLACKLGTIGVKVCLVPSLMVGFAFYQKTVLLDHIDNLADYLLGTFDHFWMVIGIFHAFQMGCFLGHALVSLLFLYSLHLGELVGYLWDRGTNPVGRQWRRLAVVILPSYLRFLHEEHNAHEGHLLQVNEHIVSPLLASWVISSLPMNIYFLVSLYFTKFTIVEKVGGALCVGLQALASSSIFGLAHLSARLHALPKMYRKIHLTLKGRLPLRDKVKLAFWYEESIRHKFYFTAGAMGKVTPHLLFEFFFIYTGHLMFTFDMIQEYFQERENNSGAR